jgi:hypothetical protein
VWVVEAGDGPRFALETLGESPLAYLDGNGAIKTRVAGLVDFAHPSSAKQGNDFIRSQPRLRRYQWHRFAMIHDRHSAELRGIEFK